MRRFGTQPKAVRLFRPLLLAVLLAAGLLSTAAGLPPQDRYPLRDVRTEQKALALTFDISWGTRMPPKVLAILVRERVPATFFLSGPWARQQSEWVRSLAQEGFEVESHGWAHVNYSGLSAAQVTDNIRRADEVLTGLIGHHPRFVRPPNGDYNARAIAAARSLGYTVVTWGTDSWDWMNPGVATIVGRVLTRAHPGDIVLLHASDTCRQTDLALPQIIAGLRRAGYRLVTLDTLMQLGTPNYRG